MYGNIQDEFFVMASRSPLGQFKMESITINEKKFASLIYKPDLKDLITMSV